MIEKQDKKSNAQKCTFSITRQNRDPKDYINPLYCLIFSLGPIAVQGANTNRANLLIPELDPYILRVLVNYFNSNQPIPSWLQNNIFPDF